MPKNPLPWYRSVAVKSCLVAFVATHIPLLALIVMIVLFPQALSPWGVFGVALVFTLLATLLATLLVITVLVRSLAHLERARTPLLNAGAQAVLQQQAQTAPARGWMVLPEVDQWEEPDRHAEVHRAPLPGLAGGARRAAVHGDGRRGAQGVRDPLVGGGAAAAGAEDVRAAHQRAAGAGGLSPRRVSGGPAASRRRS
jgi:hypothetical protein